jgi:hypothetical protein
LNRFPFLVAALVVAACVLGNAAPPTSLGDRVVAFCKQHKGKCVGKGECSNLAEAALRAAGAKSRGGHHFRRGDFRGSDFGGDFRGNEDERMADYVWGELVFVLEHDGTHLKATGQIGDVRPGDIIQFRDAELAGPSDDGRYTMTVKHHTAVVSGVQNMGMVLKIYQQNTNGRRFVTADRLRLSDLQQGRLRIFHPIPRTRNHPTD